MAALTDNDRRTTMVLAARRHAPLLIAGVAAILLVAGVAFFLVGDRVYSDAMRTVQFMPCWSTVPYPAWAMVYLIAETISVVAGTILAGWAVVIARRRRLHLSRVPPGPYLALFALALVETLFAAMFLYWGIQETGPLTNVCFG